MATRIYVLTEIETGKARLVEADSHTQALVHAAKSAWTSTAASAKDVARAMASGATIEVAEKLRPRSEKPND